MQAPSKIDIKLITLAAYLSSGTLFVWHYNYDLIEKLDPLKLLLVIIMYATVPVVFSIIFRPVVMYVIMRTEDYYKRLKRAPGRIRQFYVR